jgi:hypothetical protein
MSIHFNGKTVGVAALLQPSGKKQFLSFIVYGKVKIFLHAAKV